MSDIHDYEPLFGSYMINRLLGEGGFGEVYEVSNKLLDMEIKRAVKVIHVPDEDILNKIKRKMQIVIQLGDHDNIVSIENYTYKPGEQGGDLLILMELLTSLTTKLKSDTLSHDEVKKLGIHICRALILCNEHNVIHQDIKPANIFISKNGDYKLGDFDVARIKNDDPNRTFAGTPYFMAPEVNNRVNYDFRTDIYSLGLTMYYLLNENCLPFQNDNDNSFLEQRMKGEVITMISDVDPALSSIVLKACAYNPDDRFANAADMCEALEKLGKIEEPIHTNKQPALIRMEEELYNTAVTIEDENNTSFEIITPTTK